MRGRRRVYLVKKGNEYLQCLIGEEGETDITKYIKRYSIYRYDAVQFPNVAAAMYMAVALSGGDWKGWKVTRYDKYTLQETEVCG